MCFKKKRKFEELDIKLGEGVTYDFAKVMLVSNKMRKQE
jgi:hypothetical protein